MWLAHAAAQDRHATNTAGCADCVLDVRETTKLPVGLEVVVWVKLVQVADMVDVARVEHELVGFEHETRQERQRNNKE